MKMFTALKAKWSEILVGEFTPHDIAYGFALGTLIALTPTFGTGPLLAIPLVFVFPKINKLALFFAFVFWNPLLQIPVYTLSFTLGSILFAGLPVVNYDIGILNNIYSFTRRFIVGHMLITLLLTTLSYFIIRPSLAYYFRHQDESTTTPE